MRAQWEKNRLIDVYDKCTRVADFSSELLPHYYINQPSNGPLLHGLFYFQHASEAWFLGAFAFLVN